MIIDVDALRKDMQEESLGAFFAGGFGGALVESFEVENASDEELVRMALNNGVDLEDYQVFPATSNGCIMGHSSAVTI